MSNDMFFCSFHIQAHRPRRRKHSTQTARTKKCPVSPRFCLPLRDCRAAETGRIGQAHPKVERTARHYIPQFRCKSNIPLCRGTLRQHGHFWSPRIQNQYNKRRTPLSPAASMRNSYACPLIRGFCTVR